MEMSYDEDENRKDATIEDIGNRNTDVVAPVEPTESMENTDTDPLASIKSRLEEKSES